MKILAAIPKTDFKMLARKINFCVFGINQQGKSIVPSAYVRAIVENDCALLFDGNSPSLNNQNTMQGDFRMIKIDKAKLWNQLCSKQNNWNTVVAATTGAGKSFLLAPFVQARVLEAEAQMLALNEHVKGEG